MKTLKYIFLLLFVLSLSSQADALSIWGRWVVYKYLYQPPYGAQSVCGVYFGQDGKYDVFVNGGPLSETGTCIASNDTIYINIKESIYPERVGINFHVTYKIKANAVLEITNADMVFWKFIDSDILELDAARVDVKSSSWGRVKSLFFKGEKP